MPGRYWSKFCVYCSVILLARSNISGFIVAADGQDCKKIDKKCPPGYYQTQSCPTSPSMTTQTIDTTVDATPTNATTNNVTSTIVQDNTSTTVQNTTSTTVQNNTNTTELYNDTSPTITTPSTFTPGTVIFCMKCTFANCTSCNKSICDNCTREYKLDGNNGCIQTTEPPDSVSGNDKSALIGGVVGGVLGGLVLIGIIIFLIIWWKRRRQTEEVNERSIEDQQTNDQGHQESGKLELKEDVQRTHDKIMRYTRDPTEKKNHNNDPSENSELEDLPVAPLPPTQKFDQVARNHPISDEDNEYANNASITRALDEADDMYMNTATLKDKASRLSNQQRQSSSRRSARAVEETRDEGQDEPQEIYMNDESGLITATNENESQEIYLNEDVDDDDDIYLNVKK